MSVLNYFLDFVKFDTASDGDSATIPSTEKQKILGAHVVEIMKKIGISDAFMDEKGYVYGSIPRTNKSTSKIGFIAHLDTYGGVSGKNVSPRVIENYDGNNISLNKDVIMSPDEFETLKNHVGKTLVVTDGTTLLGGDDKAGVAEILAAAYEVINSNQPHGEIGIAFTPDEEIGRGADFFDVEGFGCDYAYTVDGGCLGELEYENFNAAAATVHVKGKSIHTGTAKNKMVNSSSIALEYCSLLPQNEVPECTENYEGFYHLDSIKGDVENSTLNFIIRDHDMIKFEKRKALMRSAADYINSKYENKPVRVEITDTYYNMKEKIENNMYIIENMKSAMKKNGVVPIIQAIRGGTDGARLSFMGLPCPNICTGAYNLHGIYEYTVVEEMEKTKDIIKTAMLDF